MSTVTHRDRRSVSRAAAEPKDATQTEADRQARRAALKQQVARREILEQRQRALIQSREKLNVEIAEAEGERNKTIDELEAELQSLEESASARIAAGLAPDAEADERRLGGIPNWMDEARKTCAAIVNCATERRAAVQRQLDPLSQEINSLPTDSALTREGVGRPDLLDEKFANDRMIEVLQALGKQAKRRIERPEDFTGTPSRLHRTWTATDRAATALAAKLAARNREIHIQLIEE